MHKLNVTVLIGMGESQRYQAAVDEQTSRIVSLASAEKALASWRSESEYEYRSQPKDSWGWSVGLFLRPLLWDVSFFEGNSMKYDAFSRYHPLVNFIFFIGAIACCVVIQHPAYLFAAFSASLSYYLHLCGNKAWKLLLASLPLMLLIAAVNPLFNTEGSHILFHIFDQPYTFEALCYGFVTAFMLASTILWFGCYNRVMTSDKFTSLFGNWSLSLLIVMVLRMIPALSKKATQISNARKCVGKGVSKNSSFQERLKSGMAILSTVTDHALNGSIITADSMRARGYGSTKRTSYQIYRFQARDYVLLFLEISLLVIVILAGRMDVTYTPVLAVQNISWGFLAYCIYLLIPLILHTKEAIQWRISISKV